MKLGKIMALAMVGLSLVSAAAVAVSFTAFDDEARQEQQLISQYEIYDKKKMYQEAVSTYRQLLNAHPDDYDIFRTYSDYCTGHEFYEESYTACKQRIDRQAAGESGRSPAALLADETWPFERVLEYMYSKQDEQFYIELHRYISTFRAEKYPAVNKYLTELYASTRGDIKSMSGNFTEVLPWDGSFALAQDSDDRYCVVGAAGSVAGVSKYGRIYSYSPYENLIACVHEDQMVYMNFSGSRKRVPFDKDNMQLLDYEYLGPFSGGIANIRLSDDNWGYISSNQSGDISLLMSGYQYAAPMKNNVGAVKSDNAWKFFVRGKNGFAAIDGSYADVYLDENQNALSGLYITENGESVYVLSAFVKMNAGDGWTPVIIRTSDDGATVTPAGSEQYSEVTPLEGYASVCSGGRWKVIDGGGNTVLSTAYDQLGGYGCGFVGFSSGGKWGYISVDGKTIIDPVYEAVLPFSSSGTAFVREEGLWHPIRLMEYVFKEEV